jgi:hypothetical protein
LAAIAAGVSFLHASGHLQGTPEQIYGRALTVLDRSAGDRELEA